MANNVLAAVVVNVGANTRPLMRELAGVRAELVGFAAGSGRVLAAGLGSAVSGAAAALARVGGLAALAGGAAAAGMGSAIKAASDLNEAVDSAKTTFGQYYGAVAKQSDDLSRRFGLSRREQIQWADSFGTLAQGIGKTEQESASLANTFNRLAADFSSKKNISFADAALKLQAGLSGEAEPLKRYIGMIDEATVKNYAVAHGMARANTELDQQTKFNARAAIIQEKMSKFLGDLERTQGSAANQTRNFWGQLENLKEIMGKDLLPAYNDVIAAGTRLVTSFRSDWEANAGVAGKLRAAIKDVGFAVSNAGTEFKLFKTQAEIALLELGADFVDLNKSWTTNLDSMKQAWTDMVTGLKQTWNESKLSDLVGIKGVMPGEKAPSFMENIGLGGPEKSYQSGGWASKVAGFFGMAGRGLVEGKKGGTGIFSTPLGEKGPASTPTLPPNPRLKELEKQAKELKDALAGRRAEADKAEADRAKADAEEAKAAKGGAGGGAAQAASAATGKAKFSDLESFARDLATGAFGKEAAATATAKNTEQTNKLLQQLLMQGKLPGYSPTALAAP